MLAEHDGLIVVESGITVLILLPIVRMACSQAFIRDRNTDPFGSQPWSAESLWPASFSRGNCGPRSDEITFEGNTNAIR